MSPTHDLLERQEPGVRSQESGERRTAAGWKPAPLAVVDLAAGFQAAVVDVLVRNTMEAVNQTRARGVVLSGGVAANTSLRETMAREAARRGVPFAVAPRRLCTDNAAMVAAAGYHVLHRRGPDGLDLDVFSTLPLGASGRGQ